MVLCSSRQGTAHDATKYARVVELVDSLDSGSSAHSGRAGSSPASRTNKKATFVYQTKVAFFEGSMSIVGVEPK